MATPDRTAFNPYYKWLGIPPESQPPSHYTLLGIPLFESDRDVIRNAAAQKMSYLKTFSTGQHSLVAERLLNEVSAAKLCLLNAEKKRDYDERLRSQTDALLPAGPPEPRGRHDHEVPDGLYQRPDPIEHNQTSPSHLTAPRASALPTLKGAQNNGQAKKKRLREARRRAAQIQTTRLAIIVSCSMILFLWLLISILQRS